jgi:hypothetical protein
VFETNFMHTRLKKSAADFYFKKREIIKNLKNLVNLFVGKITLQINLFFYNFYVQEERRKERKIKFT